MTERSVTQYAITYRIPTDPGTGAIEFDYGTEATTMLDALTELTATRGALPVGAIVVKCEITGRGAFVKEKVRA